MPSYLQTLIDNNIASPPRWLRDNLMFEGITGSVSYEVSNLGSDIDLVGFCVPPKDLVFPHIAGEIPGFGRQIEKFKVYQKHHLKFNQKEYDVCVYSIVNFFQLAMEGNPNLVDSLFLSRKFVSHSTQIYEQVRDNRHIFLHKGCWHKFRGYAYSQLSSIKRGRSKENPSRQDSIEKFGYDVKFAYNVVRLLLEVEQLLAECDLDLCRNSDILKSVRAGEWSLERLGDWFDMKEKALEPLYVSSKLPYKPDEDKIKQLLIDCLEMHYGSLSGVINKLSSIDKLVRDIEQVIDRYK